MEYIKKEELIIGEIYKSTLYNHIFKYLDKNGDKNPNISKTYNVFNKDLATIGHGLNKVINATSEEKHWLNECIKLDKFITFEEAMKTFIPEYVECTLQQMGSDYKLGEIYKVSSTSQNVNKIESHNNQGMAFYQMNKHRFKPSTKEAYDAQFVVKEPAENKTELEIWLENTKSLNLSLEDLENYIGSDQTCNFDNIYIKLEGYMSKDKANILFNKWNDQVIEPLPQFKIIETIETITKVENNEGNQFFIGDVVISSNGTIQTIESFDYNKAKTNIIAFTNKQSILGNGIGIDKIEHYIEPKVEETLLEKAKRLYPIGTICNNENIAGKDFNNNFVITAECYNLGKSIVCKSNNNESRSIYHSGKWAGRIE